MKYEYIDSEKKLSDYINKLNENNIEIIAFDIEGESNLHQYGEKLCLIQIYDGKDAVIIDPFKTPLRLIQRIIENRSIMKIMFDAPGDRAFLYKNCGIDTLSILDLQAAVRLLDYEKMDLSSVLHQAINVNTGTSKKKFQRYNWNRRPLEDVAIEYALGDVIYLFDLKDKLMSDILKKDLLEKFILKNIQSQNKPHIYDTRPGLLKSRKFNELNPAQKNIFKKLFEIRDKHAKKMNYQPHSVIPNEVLFKLVTMKTSIENIKFGRRIPDKARLQLMKKMDKIFK